MDYATNRYLNPQPVPGEGALLTLNAFLMRSTPTLDITLQPMVSFQRYSSGSGANANNRSLNTSTRWLHDQSALSLLAGYSDLSTLQTEIASTGVTAAGTRQVQKMVRGSWQLQQSEKRQLNAELDYTDVTYVGTQAIQLTGYRYPTLSIGEKFTLRPHTSLSVTASGGDLRSPSYGGSTVDEELNLGLDHEFTERYSTHGSIGYSRRTLGTGSSQGYVGNFELLRADERNKWKLSYERTVTPNGFGGLVQREHESLSVSRDLAPHLSGTLGLLDTRDREVFFFGLFQLSHRYESANGSLSWLSGETSTVGLQVGYDYSTVTTSLPVPQPASKGWHAGVSYTWVPLRRSVSR
jgi:hypothetical protein